MSCRAAFAALLVLLAPAVLRAQSSTNNLSEDFTSGSTTNSWFYFNGACLTAGSGSGGSNPGQQVGTVNGAATYYLPGCTSIRSSYYNETLVGGQNGYLGATSAPATPDASGQGALRFTNGKPGGYHQNGAIVAASPYPTGQGLQVTFKTVTYGGDSGGYAKDGADGISFYLLDGCMPITGGTVPAGCASNPIYGNSTFPGIGAWGGSLAYTCSNSNPPYDGLVGAYLGLGIDEYGNFLNGTALTNGETDYIKNSNGSAYNAGDNTASGGYYRPGRIGLRGAGSVAFQALTTAYGVNPNSGSSPYYPASLATTCTNGGVYSSATNSCGPVCPSGYSYNTAANTCDSCPSGTTFYPSGGSGGSGSCNSCPVGGTYNVTTNTCDGYGTCSNGGTYVPGTPATCSPPGTCTIPANYISSTNMCGSCAAGTYLSGSIQCAVCSTGTYSSSNGGSCSPAGTCSTGTYNSTTNQCNSCATGTLTILGGAGYCSTVCPTGYTYKTGSKITPPMSCFACTNSSGGSGTVSVSSGKATCSSGYSLSSTNLVSATATASIANNPTYNAALQSASIPVTPQPVTPATTAPTTASAVTGIPLSQVATQKTCSSGHLWNYSNATSPTDAGTATLPSDPTTPNAKNTAGILDYGALPAAFSSLPSSPPLAAEGVTTRAAATPIFYNLKITQNGLLSLSYSQGGGAYTNVINNLDITKSNGPIPSSFRFAFAGSTGGSTNIHEIMCFKAAPDVESASSVGINQQQSSRIETGTQAFFASFNPVDSTGRLAAYGISVDSSNNVSIATVANWDASCNLTGIPTGSQCSTTHTSGLVSPESPTASGSSGRQILTWNGSAGVPFEWNSLSAAQVTALGTSDRLNYLRGVRTQEINSLGSGTFRTRDDVLGDIIDSSPTWVGPPGSGYIANFKDRLYASGPVPENSATTSFLTFQQNHQNRENVVYVGSNDGMLHGFRTESSDGSGTNDGAEVLAYMPGAVVNTINNTTATLNFSSPQYNHNYFVDATPGFGDVFFGGTWHTWLAGGLGTGGAAVYILDITDPANFAETNAGSLVIGEWIAGNDATPGAISCVGNGRTNAANCGVNLGNVTDVPQMRRLHNGTWGVVFGNGVGSSTGDAGIYILSINATTGAKTWYYLSTGSGSLASQGSDGIAASATADLDGDRIIDYVYAGDINGNLWRFDLTSNDPTQWAAGATPMFKTANGQPITTPPVAGGGATSPDGLNRVMVSFGTGQKTPMTSTNPATYLKTQQSIYGVWDWNLAAFNSLSGTTFAVLSSGGTITASSTTLQAIPVTINSSGNHDVNSSPQICFIGTTDCTSGNTQYGWSIALPESNSQGKEQIVFAPELLSGVVIVDSTLPADNQPTTCTQNLDEGWTYAINILSGLPVQNFFTQYHDANEIGHHTDATGTPSVFANGTSDFLIYQKTDGGGGGTPVKGPAPNSAKRLTWIQLR
ncbi:MAG TPA: PilC/PilY family type IV pilus protein [Steroidobacteraceae bacterium]|nr:PilC/PilY family type IV pilus protein [Steroidobacteraceae bacterium]